MSRDIDMREYNELTKELLAKGYTETNFPYYVKLPGGCFGTQNPLDNLYGGFEYKRDYAEKFVYKTGCGLFVRGSEVITNFFCEGEHSHENDNPVIRCPFNKSKNCEKAFNCVHEWCECHRTNEPYTLECSLETERKKKKEHIKEKFRQFKEEHHDRVCENHMRYDEETDSVMYNYCPSHCAVCCYHPEFCPVLQKPLDKSKGNVYYDIKMIYPAREQKSGQSSLFKQEDTVKIIKGKKVFEKPISLDIAKAYVKVESKELEDKFRWNNSNEFFYNPGFRFEIFNIRAEKKETRDIFQDIEDIKAGATIIHESDRLKEAKEAKKERREKAREQKRRRLIKKLKASVELSYEEQRAVEKLFTSEEVREIVRSIKPKEEQLRLF